MGILDFFKNNYKIMSVILTLLLILVAIIAGILTGIQFYAENFYLIYPCF